MRSCTRRPTGLSASAVTTAVSSPKQRFNPRATLYSPPPSQTRNSRVVWIRSSPGSSLSITSPSETQSQRQSFFGLIFIDSVVAFLLCHACHVSRCEPRHERANDCERDQISATGNNKNRQIRSGIKQDQSDGALYEHAADRAGHATDSHHRAHRAARKHVR